MERTSNYRDPNEAGISEDERGKRLHRLLRDEAGMEKDFDDRWGEVKDGLASPPLKPSGIKFTPKKKKQK